MIKELTLGQDKIVFNDTQKQFFNAIFDDNLKVNSNNYKQYAFFGGIRAGKSYICQLSTFLLCCSYKNVNVLYIRKYYHELEDTVIKQFIKDFGKYNQFEYVKTKREAKFKNGSIIKFRALDQDGTAVLSSEYDIISFCQAEEIAQEVYYHALGRMSGKALPKTLMLLEGNPASTWVKATLKDASLEEREKSKIFFVEVTTEENRKNLPHEYIEYLMLTYPKFWINRYLYGEWSNLDEMVFSEFLESKHIVEPQDISYCKKFKMRIGMDYGWVNPTALVWAYVDYDDKIFLFSEWGGTKKTVDEIADASRTYGKIPVIADYSIKRPDRDGRSLWDDLSAKAVPLVESNKQELQNITLVNSLFKKNKLFITRNCVELIKEIRNYKWKKLRLGQEKNAPEEPIQKDNHYIDAMLYLIANIDYLHTESPKKKNYKNTLEYKFRYGDNFDIKGIS